MSSAAGLLSDSSFSDVAIGDKEQRNTDQSNQDRASVGSQCAYIRCTYNSVIREFLGGWFHMLSDTSFSDVPISHEQQRNANERH